MPVFRGTNGVQVLHRQAVALIPRCCLSFNDFVNLANRVSEDALMRQKLMDSLVPLFRRKEITPPGTSAAAVLPLSSPALAHFAEFVHTIKGEGMPHHNYPAERGDLHVKYTVRFPRTLTDKQRDGIKQLLSVQ